MKYFIGLSTLLAVMGCSDGKGGSSNKDSETPALATGGSPSTTLVTDTAAPALAAPAPIPGNATSLSPPPGVIPSPTTPEAQGAFTVAFDAEVLGETLKCYDNSASMQAEGQIFTDLRLFVSNLSLINEQGEEVKLTLDVSPGSANLQFVDPKANTIALLNFLEAGCASSDATKTLKSTISGVIPYGNYTAVKFQVGLPYPAMDAALTKVPAALAPTDMAWMWEHYPADLQLETKKGSAKKIFNALTSSTKSSVTLPFSAPVLHRPEAPSTAEAPTIDLELSKLFLVNAETFIQDLESSCSNSSSAMTESSPNCAHAFKAFGLPVSNPKAPYEQSIFSIAP